MSTSNESSSDRSNSAASSLDPRWDRYRRRRLAELHTSAASSSSALADNREAVHQHTFEPPAAPFSKANMQVPSEPFNSSCGLGPVPTGTLQTLSALNGLSPRPHHMKQSSPSEPASDLPRTGSGCGELPVAANTPAPTSTDALSTPQEGLCDRLPSPSIKTGTDTERTLLASSREDHPSVTPPATKAPGLTTHPISIESSRVGSHASPTSTTSATAPTPPYLQAHIATVMPSPRHADLWHDKSVILLYGFILLVGTTGLVAIIVARSYEGALVATAEQGQKLVTGLAAVASSGLASMLSAMSGTSTPRAPRGGRLWSNVPGQARGKLAFTEPFPDADSFAAVLDDHPYGTGVLVYKPLADAIARAASSDANVNKDPQAAAARLAEINAWYKKRITSQVEPDVRRIVEIGALYGRLTLSCQRNAGRVPRQAEGPASLFGDDAGSQPCPPHANVSAWVAVLASDDGHLNWSWLRTLASVWTASRSPSRLQRTLEAGEAILASLERLKGQLANIDSVTGRMDIAGTQQSLEQSPCKASVVAERDAKSRMARLISPQRQPLSLRGLVSMLPGLALRAGGGKSGRGSETLDSVEQSHKDFAAIAVVCRIGMAHREGVVSMTSEIRSGRTWAEARAARLGELLDRFHADPGAGSAQREKDGGRIHDLISEIVRELAP